MIINTYIWSEMGQEEKEKVLQRSEIDIQEAVENVSKIVRAVRDNGDTALKELCKKYDKAPDTLSIRVPENHFSDAEKELPEEVKRALDYSVENVRRFHGDQSPNGITWKEIRPGIMAGERTTPIDNVALYVPRGKGSFPSMAYMMAVPAKIAGVKRTVLASPPDSTGRVDPGCLYVARQCGINEVYAMGGAQAWAAFAYGTETVKKVDKCIGPGGPNVAAAKRLLGDCLDCGLPAGPSESIVLADESADSLDIARNLLVESEHGSDSSVLLITNSTAQAEEVKKLLSNLVDRLPDPRDIYAKDVFSGYGGVIVVNSIEDGAEIANQIATEHLQIRTVDPFATLGLISNAGEIILGANCPFSAANYSVGANAVLPTGGCARTWSGVSVADFKKRSSVIYMSVEGFRGLSPYATALAKYEEFPAHRNALINWEEKDA